MNEMNEVNEGMVDVAVIAAGLLPVVLVVFGMLSCVHSLARFLFSWRADEEEEVEEEDDEEIEEEEEEEGEREQSGKQFTRSRFAATPRLSQEEYEAQGLDYTARSLAALRQQMLDRDARSGVLSTLSNKVAFIRCVYVCVCVCVCVCMCVYVCLHVEEYITRCSRLLQVVRHRVVIS